MSVVVFQGKDSRNAAAADREQHDLLTAVIEGLSRPQKAIPSRFFYDLRGSRLFEEITTLEEYYPTRAELEILLRQGHAIAAAAQGAQALIEFGAGSSRKVRALLQAMPAIDIYAPIDISADFLRAEARLLDADLPHLKVMPVIADFMQPVTLPAEVRSRKRLVFFPGSTIGNLKPREGLHLLERMASAAGNDGMVLVGVDLKKDRGVLLRAYDDARGVTAEFNLNVLRRINEELGADFDLSAFAHEARYDESHGRIEMHLVSKKKQTVNICKYRFDFAEGETIHTENAYKFTVEEFHLLARAAGLTPAATWLDSECRYSLHLFSCD